MIVIKEREILMTTENKQKEKEKEKELTREEKVIMALEMGFTFIPENKYKENQVNLNKKYYPFIICYTN